MTPSDAHAQTSLLDPTCAKKAQVDMVRALPPLNALRAFEAAGRHQSFSQAADELGVSHSAISRHVRALEHRLGVQLFRAQSRGVALTQDGQAYLDRILPALDAIGAATESLTEAPAGQITVNAEPFFAAKILMPLLVRMHRDLPEIDVRVEASHDIADIERYEADFAVRFRRVGQPDLPSDLLSNAPIRAYAAPKLAPAGHLTPLEVAEMRRFKDRGEDTWARWFAMAGHPGAVPTDDGWRMRANLAFEAAIHAGGVYLGSSECPQEAVDAGQLIQVSDISIWWGGYYLVYGSRGLRTKAARQFRSWILDHTRRHRHVIPDDQPIS